MLVWGPIGSYHPTGGGAWATLCTPSHRTDVSRRVKRQGLKERLMPETQQHNESARRPKPSIFSRDPPLWLLPSLTALMLATIILIPTRPRTPDDLSAKQIARDAAARERAGEFVRGLGFEPEPALCRARSSGSAWCTVRVAGSDKTFSLWCSWRHPTCIENLPRE